MTGWLDERMEWNVLEVFAAIDEGEAARLSIAGGRIMVGEEGVRAVVGDVIVVLSDIGEDAGNEVFGEGRDGGGVDLQEELVEEGGGCAHDVAGVIEPTHARHARSEFTAREVGAQIFHRDEAIGCRIPSAKLERVEFVHGAVAGNQQLIWSTLICDEKRERGIRLDEIGVGSNGGPSVCRASISGVDELERKSASPVIGD